MKIYKDYTKDLCSFLVNNTSLSSNNSLKSRKNLLWKGLLARKLKQSITKLSKNKVQYDLDQQTAEISVLSSGNVS